MKYFYAYLIINAIIFVFMMKAGLNRADAENRNPKR